MKYLLDTNICIYIRRNRPAQVLTRFRSLLPGAAVMSVITYGELRYGAEKSSERARTVGILEELIALIPVESLTAAAGEAYGVVRATLSVQGAMIGNNDLWIAAHARALGYVLITNNEREFRRIPGLVVENWAEAYRGLPRDPYRSC